MSASRQALFLTGQSDPRSCALSPVQRRFLDDLGLPGVPVNFPYVTGAAWREVSLVAASARHVGLAARIRTAAWRERHREPVLAQLARADSSLILAGSIGLELVRRLDLPAHVLARCAVFAYGATTRWDPPGPIRRVRGDIDRIARATPADVLVHGGHLDYLGNPEVLSLARAFAEETR